MRRAVCREGAVWFTTIALTLFGVLACAPDGAPQGSGTTEPSTTSPVEDLDMQASDFVNIAAMTPVKGYFLDNRLGHLDEALAVATSDDGGVYPVGTIIQLVPQEAMVKRRAGWDPTTNDWEFFALDVSEAGTTIVTRGAEETVNQFGGSCAGCHLAADPRFDLVCEGTHGCEPLPIGDDVIRAVQASDPRPMP
jgi:hypothetical protein